MAFPISSSPASVAGAVPAAANPAYSGTFIPEIWSGKLLEKFYSACVLAAISNTEYEGEIKSHGDKVIIRQVPTLTIRDYEATGPITTERPSAPVKNLLIDKGKYFSAVLDDVLRRQADIDQLNIWADDAAEQLKIAIDTQVLAAIPAKVAAENKGATAGKISGNINLGKATAPITVGPTDASGIVGVISLLIDMGVCLDEQNVPEPGRWVVLPAWAVGMLLKSDVRAANIMGDGTSALRNGRVGQISRFTVYQSNLLPTAVESTKTAFHVFAGHNTGLTFASQLTEMETLRVESTFGTLMRGLQVYGFEVLKPESIVDGYIVR
jgi:hypothetical protein